MKIEDLYLKFKRTEKELEEISIAIQEEYRKYKKLPRDFKEFINISPLRKEWEKDAWGENYIYNSDEKSFSIRSKGKDRMENTEDDINVSKKISME